MNFKTLIVMIGLVGLMTVPAFAGSVTFDFVFFAAGNEHGQSTETFFSDGLSVNTSARNLANTVDFNIYLDDLLGGDPNKPGGLGVCQTANCAGSSDDNLTIGEVLARIMHKLL